MSSDIVKRLRVVDLRRLMNEAADAIEERDAEVDRLRAERDAIDAMHQPIGKPAGCCSCWKAWPCRTHLLLHPEEARRG